MTTAIFRAVKNAEGKHLQVVYHWAGASNNTNATKKQLFRQRLLEHFHAALASYFKVNNLKAFQPTRNLIALPLEKMDAALDAVTLALEFKATKVTLEEALTVYRFNKSEKKPKINTEPSNAKVDNWQVAWDFKGLDGKQLSGSDEENKRRAFYSFLRKLLKGNLKPYSKSRSVLGLSTKALALEIAHAAVKCGAQYVTVDACRVIQRYTEPTKVK